MSKAWAPDKPQARVYLALRAAGTAGLDYEQICTTLSDVPRNVVSQTINRLKTQAYVVRERSATAATGWVIRINQAAALPPLAGLTVAEASADEARLGALAAAAGKLLMASDRGSDSECLATALDASINEIDAALLPAVVDRKLVTCALARFGGVMQHYRISSEGAAHYDWRTECEAAWQRQNGAMTQALNARAPAAIRADVASEVMEATVLPTPAPAAMRVPYLGTLDIDAIQAKYPARTPARTPAPAPAADAAVSAAEKQLLQHLGDEDLGSGVAQALAETAEAAEFLAALYSDGQMLIQSGTRQVHLPLAHTTKLLHYLDHMRAGDLVASVAAEAPV
jgi:hypothetical protein